MKVWFFVLSLLIISPLANANTEIHTIPLKHRLASEVLPQIEAFIPETATIRAYNGMLILKSDRATLANVELLLEKLDTPQQSVLISVMRSNEELNHAHGNDTNVSIEADNDDIRASVGISRWSTHGSLDQNQHYKARGLAGQPVAISLGEDVPQHQQLVFVSPYGVSVSHETQYISTANGFQAVPYLLGNGQVRVEIHPFFSKLSRVNGEIHSSDVITNVSGRVGEWLEIGRIENNATLDNDGVTTYRTHDALTQIIYLKIELSN